VHVIIIPEVTFNFAKDHGYSISGKVNAVLQFEIIYGFHQTDAADLKKVVHIFAAIGKILEYT